MSSQYKRTAKDLAFERERTKLQSKIQKLNEENIELKTKLNKATRDIESLNRTVEIMESAFQIPREDLIANMERTKKVASFVESMAGRAIVEIVDMYEGLGLK